MSRNGFGFAINYFAYKSVKCLYWVMFGDEQNLNKDLHSLILIINTNLINNHNRLYYTSNNEKLYAFINHSAFFYFYEFYNFFFIFIFMIFLVFGSGCFSIYFSITIVTASVGGF